MAITVGDIRKILDEAYPPHLAESWDKVGLICGDPDEEVTTVAFALDCTAGTVADALAVGAQMLVVHHPFLLKGVTSVAADTPKGELIHRMIRQHLALFAAHTNADAARPGVNDQLATLIGLSHTKPMVPQSTHAPLHHWGVHVPVDAVDQVKRAIFDAGAGHIGFYTDCSFEFTGQGQFTPIDGAHPTVGHIGHQEKVTELRVEFIAPASKRNAIAAALRAAHPYEEIAHDCIAMEDTSDPYTAPGLGRVGTLDEPCTFGELVQRVADNLPQTVWGVRAAGDPMKPVTTVAVCSGAGDSFLSVAAKLGVDAYVTSDLRHHPVDEYLRAGGPAVIDTAHWASEYPWTTQAAQLVTHRTQGAVATKILAYRTDPWTISAHATH